MTGGATGIGEAIKRRLREEGNEVVVVDIKDADIIADLSTGEGRAAAIDALRERASDGLDGLVTCAGVGSNVPNHPLITQVNYFGTVELVEGVKALLAMRRGAVVLVSSNSAPMNNTPDFVELLLAGREREAVDKALTMEAQEVYSGTKNAVARWMRARVVEYEKGKEREAREREKDTRERQARERKNKKDRKVERERKERERGMKKKGENWSYFS